jgi:uncharacterized protein (TIGR00255 family)
MKSMTGYGRAEFELPDHIGVIELSSVNKRGFEFLFQGPREWHGFERKSQQLIRQKIERGRIRLSIVIQSNLINTPLLENSLHKRVSQQLINLKDFCQLENIPFKPSVDLIHRIISSISHDTMVPNYSKVEEVLTLKTQSAIQDLILMRMEEGQALAKDFQQRINELERITCALEGKSRGVAVHWKERLIQRLKESGVSVDTNDDLIRREFAVYAEKSDISEEITRIKSHLQQLQSNLNTDHSVGRKLEFVVQELGREFNTLSSKSLQSDVSNLAIEAKVELEKIREQCMNIE